MQAADGPGMGALKGSMATVCVRWSKEYTECCNQVLRWSVSWWWGHGSTTGHVVWTYLCTSERTKPVPTGGLPLSFHPTDKGETGQVLLEPIGQWEASSLPPLVMSPCHSFLLGRAACGLLLPLLGGKAPPSSHKDSIIHIILWIKKLS